MNFIEYSPLALRTLKPFPHDQQVQHALLGMVTEAGELADAIKKHVIYGKPLDKVNVMEEIADLMWYLNVFMVERSVGSRLVDDIWGVAVVSSEQDSLNDPWVLVEVALAASQLVSALSILDEKTRGARDKETLAALVGILSILLLHAGYTLSDALTTNINKLAKRYGDKYTDYAALNRDTDSERLVLENFNGKVN